MLKITCVLAVIALASASDVLDLKDSNFESEVGQRDIILIEFFAPWCGHCKRLAPEFEKAATALKYSDPPVSLAKVDCTAETGTCGKHGVSGYPTLKIFRNGEVAEDYNGPREADGIVKYMRSKAGPSSKELKTLEDAAKFINNDEAAIIGFFEAEGSEIQKQFMKLADAQNEDHRFAHTFNKEILEKYAAKDDIILFRPKRLQNKFEDKEVKYDGDAVLHKMKTWLLDSVHGLAGHRTAGNSAQFKRPLVVAYYDVDYVKNTKGSNYWRNRVMKVGKKIKETRTVYFAVSGKDDFSNEMSEFGLDSHSEKPVVAARDASDQKFVMSDEFSMETFEKFVNDFLDGNLTPYLKSEPLPDNSNANVKTLVAANFNEIVNDPTKDVLIEFYAPWCGHCKTLAPKYEELAEKLAGEENIVIAKMDATANDVPKEYQVSGFPTLFYSPAGSKSNPKKYEGGREVNDFVQYIAKESTEPLKGYTRDGKKKSKTEL